MAYVLISKLPKELVLYISEHDNPRKEHKQKLSKCFDIIHNVSRYKAYLNFTDDQIVFDSLTIWGVIDIIISNTLLTEELFSTSIKSPKILRSEKKRNYNLEYIIEVLSLIGGFHNLDNIASKISPELKDQIYKIEFVKKDKNNNQAFIR